MREALYTKLLTIALQPDLFNRIKEITDREKISMAQWFRKVAEKALANARNREEANHDR